MGLLNKHPFPVEAHFSKSLVLGFSVPKEELESLLPDCLELDLYQDRWAFLAVAMVQTQSLRPKGYPKILGRDFTLIGYRVFVRYRDRNNRRLRGLYIIGSETNNASMKRLGSIFTQYKYQTTSIDWQEEDHIQKVKSSKGLQIVAKKSGDDPALPENSPFPNWKKARQFAGPMPFTFTYDEKEQEVTIIEGVRSSWTPQPMSVSDFHIPFLERLNLKHLTLANAFMVENVPYHWKRGRVESLRK